MAKKPTYEKLEQRVKELEKEILEHRRTGEALRKSEELFRTIVETAPSLLIICDSKGNNIYVSPNCEEIFGYTQEELRAEPIWWVHEDDTPRAKHLYGRTFSEGVGGRDFEYKAVKKNGELLYASSSWEPLRDAEGEFKGIVFQTIDITDRVRAEEALKSQLELERLVADISTSFINTTPDNIDHMIDRALEMIGSFSGVDRSYVFLFYDNGTKMDNTHEWCAEGIEPQIDNLKGLSVDAMPWWMDKLNRFENIHIPCVSALPPEAGAEKQILQSQDIQSLIVVPMVYGGSLLGFLGFDSVRVEKIWSEETITLLHLTAEIFANALEHRQAEKERKQLEAQFQQAQKMEAIGTLAGGIAHDFNNLLTPVLGYAELGRGRADAPKEIAEALDTIRRQTLRAVELVRQILDFARRRTDDARELDVAALIKEGMRFMERTLPSNIRLRLTINGERLFVKASPTAIQQILTNLAMNAKAAMPQGGEFAVEVSGIELYPGRPLPIQGLRPGKWVRLRFRDTGGGIAREHLSKIFEPFFTTRAAEGGSGLGLSQVYGIVQQCGGLIDVQSEPGKGTVFTIYLPAASPRAAEAAETPPKPALFKSPASPKGRVLVAEDAPPVRRLIALILRKGGYEALEAPDGEIALDLFEKAGGAVDAVVTDWVMPRLSGAELIRRLRQRKPDLPAVVVSGYPLGKSHEAQGLGLDAWLDKPMGAADLLEAVRKAIERRAAASEAQD